MKFLTSSIGRKFMMALTGFFLMIFLLVHLAVNFALLAGTQDASGNLLPKDEILFNQASHFMATNPIIQAMQFVLAAGFIYHIFLGIMLTLKNKEARGSNSYASNKWEAHTPIASRTMIYTGILVLIFLGIHIADFLIPIKSGQVEVLFPQLGDYGLIKAKFESIEYVIIYVISFILLGLHLSHGFTSAFQSTGMNHKKYNSIIKYSGVAYFWFISLGFSIIAIYFFVTK
ncbi:MAG: succinate dehydrogenase cytochrome b subunit [Flavobacteriales bacterium]